MDQRSASDSRAKGSRAARAVGMDDASTAMLDISSQTAEGGCQVEANADTDAQRQQHRCRALGSRAQAGPGAEQAQGIQVCCLKLCSACLTQVCVELN